MSEASRFSDGGASVHEENESLRAQLAEAEEQTKETFWYGMAVELKNERKESQQREARMREALVSIRRITAKRAGEYVSAETKIAEGGMESELTLIGRIQGVLYGVGIKPGDKAFTDAPHKAEGDAPEITDREKRLTNALNFIRENAKEYFVGSEQSILYYVDSVLEEEYDRLIAEYGEPPPDPRDAVVKLTEIIRFRDNAIDYLYKKLEEADDTLKREGSISLRSQLEKQNAVVEAARVAMTHLSEQNGGVWDSGDSVVYYMLRDALEALND